MSQNLVIYQWIYLRFSHTASPLTLMKIFCQYYCKYLTALPAPVASLSTLVDISQPNIDMTDKGQTCNYFDVNRRSGLQVAFLAADNTVINRYILLHMSQYIFLTAQSLTSSLVQRSCIFHWIHILLMQCQENFLDYKLNVTIN